MEKIEKQYLTKEWYEKLVAELHLLREEKLPSVMVRLKDALGQWDISENAEYDTAIMEQELTEARITEIEFLLKNVEIIDEKKVKWSKEVRYGSQVTIELDNGKKYVCNIVGTWEVEVLTDPIEISFESPIGEAIKGKKVGDVCKVRADRGRFDVKILDIK